MLSEASLGTSPIIYRMTDSHDAARLLLTVLPEMEKGIVDVVPLVQKE